MAEAITQTNFELPGQISEVYHGKVADTYTIERPDGEGDLLVVVRTDRISAFDVVLPEPIPHKGEVLNQMAAYFLRATADEAPNWLLEIPDPNVTIGLKTDPIKVEMIARRFLLGSAWKAYNEQDVREICGNIIPDNMIEFEAFPQVLITPTTKAEEGHDENITPEEIVEQGLATEEEYDEMDKMVRRLFGRGGDMAMEQGLLLADTKYEFGRLATGSLIVIDEVHTPDSSRYFFKDEYWAYLEKRMGERPEQLSKEFVREWLVARGFSGQEGQTPPLMPEDFVEEVSARYIDLYERMIGKPFEAADGYNPLVRIEGNIVRCLSDLTIGA